MADFWQQGAITVLQRLKNRPVEDLEAEIEAIARRRKIVLLLPALYSEFETPAMPRIIEELKEVHYLHKIVLSLDRATVRQFRKVKKIMAALPTEVRIVWHDGPRMQTLLQELVEADFELKRAGKGRSVWMALGSILANRDVYAIALHDCDIVNYQREMLARLIYPVVHPAIDLEFSKGYYARVAEKFYGRVTRLFYTPLVRTLKRILGYHPFVEYLDDFRYALSGEFACVSSLIRGLRISPTWGLEVSMLSEVYHKTSVNRICQVEVMDTYEHKHQTLERDKQDEGLSRMANDIAQAMFRVLGQDGLVMSQSFFRTLLTSYIQESRVAIEKYHALSLLSGLPYDRHGEIEASEIFVGSLKLAMLEFVKDPVGIPMMPAWVRVAAAMYLSSITGTDTSSGSFVSFRLYEQLKCLTAPGDNALWFMYEPVLISLKSWNKLNAAQQAALRMENGQPTAIVYRTTKGWQYGIEGRASHGAGHKLCADAFFGAVAPLLEGVAAELPRCPLDAQLCQGGQDSAVIEKCAWDALLVVRRRLETDLPVTRYLAGRLLESRDCLDRLVRLPRAGAPHVEAVYETAREMLAAAPEDRMSKPTIIILKR